MNTIYCNIHFAREHNSEKKLTLKPILYKCSVVQLKCEAYLSIAVFLKSLIWYHWGNLKVLLQNRVPDFSPPHTAHIMHIDPSLPIPH